MVHHGHHTAVVGWLLAANPPAIEIPVAPHWNIEVDHGASDFAEARAAVNRYSMSHDKTLRGAVFLMWTCEFKSLW